MGEVRNCKLPWTLSLVEQTYKSTLISKTDKKSFEKELIITRASELKRTTFIRSSSSPLTYHDTDDDDVWFTMRKSIKR